MARCGCQGAGSTTCEAIVRCVAASLGPGISFTNGRIQVRLSRDAGNCIRYGSDQGLYAPCDGSGPGPGPGGRTVDGLPTPAFGGTSGGASLMAAYTAPYAAEYAISNRIDIIDAWSWALADNVAAWAPYGGTTAQDFFSTSPSGAQAQILTSAQWSMLVSDAGSPGINPTGRNSGAREEDLEPDGGWYGFYQPHYTYMTTISALDLIHARAVVFLRHFHDGDLDVPGNIDAILSTQAQEWTIPFVQTTGMTSVTQYLDVGIRHVGVGIGDDDTITPQQVIDSGATWARLNEAVGIPRIQEFISAGINVVSGVTSRQTHAAALIAAGVKAIVCGDPVYARGVLESERDYRRTSVTFGSRQTEVGTLTSRTDSGEVLDTRGYAEQDEVGRFFQPEFGWVNGRKRFTPCQLLGQLCPLPDPTDYTIRMETQVDQGTLPAGNFPYLGFLVANDNDLDPSRFVGDPVQTTRHGYLAHIRVGTGNTGILEIGVFSASGVLTNLVTSATGQPISPNAWVSLQLDVTATGLTLTRTDGTPYSVTTNDTTWRGPYAYYAWNDTSTSTVFSPFAHGYRAVSYSATGGGGENWNQLSIDYATWAEMAADRPTWEELATPQVGAVNSTEEPGITGN